MVTNERKVQWKYYFAAGLVTLVIFLVGIYFSFFLDKMKVVSLEESVREMRITQEDAELEMTAINLLGGRKCDVLLHEIEGIVPKAAELGEKLEFYEARERFKDPIYPSLKKDYTLTLVRYWLFVSKAKDECKYGYEPILYFYSNEKCDDCIRQGTVLSYLKEQHPQKIMVFAIDNDIKLGSIALIKGAYNVTKTPSIILNETLYEGLQDLGKTRTLLNLSS